MGPRKMDKRRLCVGGPVEQKFYHSSARCQRLCTVEAAWQPALRGNRVAPMACSERFVFSGNRHALRPRLLVLVGLVAAIPAYGAAFPDEPLTLVEQGCLVGGFLAYKVGGYAWLLGEQMCSWDGRGDVESTWTPALPPHGCANTADALTQVLALIQLQLPCVSFALHFCR